MRSGFLRHARGIGRSTLVFLSISFLLIVACGSTSDLDAYRLAVALQQGKNPDIFIMDGCGRVVERVTSTPNRSEMWPTWHPDGRSVLYEARDKRDWHVILGMRDLGHGSEDTLYSRFEKGALWFAVSADGNRLAYIAKDSSGIHLDVRDLQSGMIRVVNHEAESLIRPEWAADSRHLLCQARDTTSSTWDLVIIDTETGTRTVPVASEGRTRFKARWSPDDQSIVYCVEHDDQRRNVGMSIADVIDSRVAVLADGTSERVVSGVWASTGALAALRERPLPLTILIWPDPWNHRESLETVMDGKLRRGRIVWSHDGRYIAANVTARRRGKEGGWTIVVLDKEGRIIRNWDHDLDVICPAWAPFKIPL